MLDEEEDSKRSKDFFDTMDEEMKKIKGRELTDVMVDISVNMYEMQKLGKEYKDV